MLSMILRRLGTSSISIALLVTIVFFMIHATPGGPAYSILGVRATPTAVAALDKQMGLNHPVWQQYGTWWPGCRRAMTTRHRCFSLGTIRP